MRRLRGISTLVLGPALMALAAVAAGGCRNGQEAADMSDAKPDDNAPAWTRPAAGEAVATFAAGCFWGIEATFRRVPGVTDAAVGYSGGQMLNPTYKDVCTSATGHAEVVRVTYDPAKVCYEQLLEAFWKCHDPTQVNRQGPDVGTQYRSAIFVHTPEQAAAAKTSKARLQAGGKLKGDVATEIVPAAAFYRAEEYHQRYLEKRGQASCPSTSP